MGEYSDQEREGKPKGDDIILASLRRENTNFGRMKTKGIVTKRRNIALF